jgi:hypothetical protein
MLQRMAEAEQEQQECPFRPLAQNGRTASRHQHQEINFKTAPADGFKSLFRREKTSEKVSPDVAGQRYPAGQTFHERQPEPNAEQRPAQDGKNQFGFFAEDAAVGMAFFFAFLVAVFFAGFVFVLFSRLVFVLFGGLFFRNGQPRLSDSSFDFLQVGLLRVELDAQCSGGRGDGLDDAGLPFERFAHLPGMALVADALHIEQQVAEAASEFSPALPGNGFHFFQRDAAGVVVDAQQRRVAVLDVGFFDAFLFFQRGNETVNAKVFFVGDFREEEGDIEFEFFHDELFIACAAKFCAWAISTMVKPRLRKNAVATFLLSEGWWECAITLKI